MQLGDRGAQALAFALPSLALESLDLGFNDIRAPGVAALMQAVVNSPALTGLSLSGNNLDAEAAKAIQGALCQPRCVLPLSVCRTPLPESPQRAHSLEVDSCGDSGVSWILCLSRSVWYATPGDARALRNSRAASDVRFIGWAWTTLPSDVPARASSLPAFCLTAPWPCALSRASAWVRLLLGSVCRSRCVRYSGVLARPTQGSRTQGCGASLAEIW